MRLAILALRTEANAVSERRSKAIEIGQHDIHVLIHDKTGQVLAHTLPHRAFCGDAPQIPLRAE